MIYKNFREFVSGFDDYKKRKATTIRPFIKNHSLNYGQLQGLVYKSANYLLNHGVKKGDRVMVISTNNPQWQILNLGCLVIGAILVPVDYRNSLETVLGFAKQTEPKLLFRSKDVLPKLDKKLQKAVIIETYEELIADYPSEDPAVELNEDEAAVIIFTSGTTAAPKGVVLSQKNLLANVEGVRRAIKINPNWRVLSVLPLSHSYEYTCELCMMSKGVQICYLPKITPLAIARGLNEYKITTLVAVPQLLALFKQRIEQTAVTEGQENTLKLGLKIAPYFPKRIKRMLFAKVHKKLGGKLGLVITGGAPIPPDVAIFWEKMGLRALQGYGLTETSPILTVNKLKDKFRDSQGQALHNVQLKIADNGEILAKGPSIFAGYYKDKNKTKEAFTKDGWFKTGDVGQTDKDGWLKIQGRAKFMIVLPSGLNVFPEDIELVAEKQRAIKEICVVGVKKADGEEVFAAIVSDKKDKKIIKAIKEINEKLEDFQHISNWARWPEESFPRTLIMKIDRKAVAQWANQAIRSKAQKEGQKSADSDPIITILKQVLNNQNVVIGERDRLADIGIDSLRRLAVVSMVEEQLGVALQESDITKTTSVASLRKMVSQGSRQSSSAKRTSWQFWHLTRVVGFILRETAVRLFLATCTRIKVVGKNNLKSLKQPAIFIFNHVDNLDAMVVYKSLPWRFGYKLSAAQAEDFLKKHRLIKFFARLIYASFNFSRTDNILSGLEYSAERLDSGWHVLMSPEGTISPKGKLTRFKSGIGLLAVETGAPVVPVKIEGLFGTLPLHKKFPKKYSKVTVKIGSPQLFDKQVTYEKAAKELYKVMKKL